MTPRQLDRLADEILRVPPVDDRKGAAKSQMFRITGQRISVPKYGMLKPAPYGEPKAVGGTCADCGRARSVGTAKRCRECYRAHLVSRRVARLSDYEQDAGAIGYWVEALGQRAFSGEGTLTLASGMEARQGRDAEERLDGEAATARPDAQPLEPKY